MSLSKVIEAINKNLVEAKTVQIDPAYLTVGDSIQICKYINLQLEYTTQPDTKKGFHKALVALDKKGFRIPAKACPAIAKTFPEIVSR